MRKSPFVSAISKPEGMDRCVKPAALSKKMAAGCIGMGKLSKSQGFGIGAAIGRFH